jgi:hypothetical protein
MSVFPYFLIMQVFFYVDNVFELAGILDCGIVSLPLKYIGLPLGASHKAMHIWDGVIEKIKCRLASWKMLYLSKGGRLTLIKSTLSNLPTYFMSLFPISMGVANHIEKLQCDFLWGGLDKEFKYYLRWSIVCTLISEGGLTVRNLLRFDHVLLGKWLWCYGLERKAWCTKYGSSWRDWCCWKPIEVYGVGLWKNIMSGWGKFSSHTRFEVGDGSKV